MTQCIGRNIVIGAWVCALLACAWWQLGYERTAGPRRNIPLEAPYTRLGANPGRPLVVMALHPRCPCSAASLANLEREALRWPADVQVRVLRVIPPGVPDPERWIEAPVFRDAARLGPDVLVTDPGAAIAGALGMQTSGHVIVFDTAGHAVFNGGITLLRGQGGESECTRMLAEAVDHATRRIPDGAAAVSLPVFGCQLGSIDPTHDGCGDDTP